MLQFGAVAGVGMVGADSCGFGGNTTETLCARWAWCVNTLYLISQTLTDRLGALSPFYRNHNELGNIPQEFYRWNLTTIAARAAGKTRLRLLDYAYTFLHKQHTDGTPALWPLSWVHPDDANTISIEHQYYFGPSLLVSPVVAENSTSVDIYLPNATFYDFFTLDQVQGQGSNITIENVDYDTIPLHILGGSIVALRTGNATTTADNRQLPFDIVVAPNATSQAEGYLRLDDGISIDVGDKYSDVYFVFDGEKLDVSGNFGYVKGSNVGMVVFAGQTSEKRVQLNGNEWDQVTYDSQRGTISVYGLNRALGDWTIALV
jgi:alpha-glucosidase